MSIDPIATAQHAAPPVKTAAATGNPAGLFEEYLARTGEQVTPENAAEALRLKMLSSALYLGGEAEGAQPQRTQGMQGLLDRFLEQLPAAAPRSGDSGESSEAVAAGDVSGNVPLDAPAPPVRGGDSLGPNPGTDAIIEKAARRYGIDGELIRAVIKAESNFNPKAVSSAGAQGLMQLMPATARGLGVSDSFDPEQNVMAGTRFLKDMLRRYHGNLDEALAAYNWGPGKVDKYGTDRLPRETRAYLAKVKGYYIG